MKPKITLLALIMTLITIQTLYGQKQQYEPSGSKFGLGASTGIFELAPINSIYLTIDMGSVLRFEPVIAFEIAEGYREYSVTAGFFKKNPYSNFDLLYGLRFGLYREETTVIAPTIGGEYYFMEKFSLGSEVQLKGLITDDKLEVITNTSIIVRFYF
jgi:hypothetical protein